MWVCARLCRIMSGIPPFETERFEQFSIKLNELLGVGGRVVSEKTPQKKR